MYGSDIVSRCVCACVCISVYIMMNTPRIIQVVSQAINFYVYSVKSQQKSQGTLQIEQV